MPVCSWKPCARRRTLYEQLLNCRTMCPQCGSGGDAVDACLVYAEISNILPVNRNNAKKWKSSERGCCMDRNMRNMLQPIYRLTSLGVYTGSLTHELSRRPAVPPHFFFLIFFQTYNHSCARCEWHEPAHEHGCSTRQVLCAGS